MITASCPSKGQFAFQAVSQRISKASPQSSTVKYVLQVHAEAEFDPGLIGYQANTVPLDHLQF